MKGVGQKRSRERKEEKVGSCEEGATINERMVGRRVGWMRFHKSTCGFPVYPILLSLCLLGELQYIILYCRTALPNNLDNCKLLKCLLHFKHTAPGHRQQITKSNIVYNLCIPPGL